MRKVILDFSADRVNWSEPYKFDCHSFTDNFFDSYLCGFENECYALQLVITEQLRG